MTQRSGCIRFWHSAGGCGRDAGDPQEKTVCRSQGIKVGRGVKTPDRAGLQARQRMWRLYLAASTLRKAARIQGAACTGSHGAERKALPGPGPAYPRLLSTALLPE